MPGNNNTISQQPVLPLRRRLIISSLLGTIPLIILGIVLLFDRYNSRRDLIMQSNLTQAKLAAAYIQGWLEGHIRTLKTLADANEVQHGSRADISGLIKRQIHAQPEWRDLFVTDQHGYAVAMSVSGHLNAGDREYFQQVKRTQQPAISNLLASRVTREQIVIVAYPIIRHGQFTGVVAAVLTPKTLQELFAQFPTANSTFIGLWGSDRRLIARTNISDSMVGQKYVAPDSDIVLSGQSGARIAVSPVTHQRVLIGYAPVQVASWTVVIGTPLTVALTPVYSTMAIFLLFSSLVLAVTLLWSIYSTNIIARQVSLLANSARAIGAGHFTTRIALHTGDELEDLANSLNKMAADLALIDRLKSDLLGMVSHELKTPLTSIRTSLEVLSSGLVTPDNPHFAEMLAIAERQTRRLQDMIENLISVARMEAGGFAVTPSPTLLAPILNASVRQYEGLARDRGLALLVEAPADIRVLADVPKATLALNNLLDNAIKFTERGSITVRAQVQEHEAVITVTDTGKGVSVDVRPRLFEAFYQAEPLLTRKAGGAGLGLPVTRAIVEAHGGQMIVESAGAEQGSTFGFTLPLA